jgi:hypothetical protein
MKLDTRRIAELRLRKSSTRTASMITAAQEAITAGVEWNAKAVTEELVSALGAGKEGEELEEVKTEIEDSLDLDGGRWEDFGDAGEFKFDGEEYNLIHSEDEAERIAIEYCEQTLTDEPEIFTPSFIQQYMTISETDRRLMAQEEADSYMDGRSDADVLSDAEMTDEYSDAEAEDDQKKMDKILEDAKEKANEKRYDEVFKGLENPVQYLVEDQGIYTREELFKQNFISLDVEEAAKAAVKTDGWAHFLSLYDGEYKKTPNGLVYFHES